MIQLKLTLEEHLQRSAITHAHLCPRQVVGVRLARLACAYLEIDPAVERKQIYVIMEVGHCAADGVRAVTGASPLNGYMRLIDYGKVAATFVDLRTGQTVRVSERLESRDTAVDMMPANMSSWDAQLHAYQVMADEYLLRWQEVEIIEDLVKPPGAPNRVRCVACGDVIHEFCEVEINGEPFCKPCAHGAYFVPVNAVAGAYTVALP